MHATCYTFPMSMEGMTPTPERPTFHWEVEESRADRVDIRLHKGNASGSIGELFSK